MDESMNRSRGASRVKIFAGLVAMAFAVTLAVIVGSRLSDEALAVLAGAVCGVGAAIPTSLLIVAVSRRQDERRVQPCWTVSRRGGRVVRHCFRVRCSFGSAQDRREGTFELYQNVRHNTWHIQRQVA